MAREVVMGIDIGTSAVKTVIAEKKSGERFPFVLGAGYSQSQGLRRGCIINQHDVATAIKNSIKKARQNVDASIRKVLVSIGGVGLEGIRSRGSIAIARADHEITENDIKRAISQSETQLTRNSTSYLLNRDVLHSFPISYKIDDEPVIGNPLSMKGEKLEVETLFVTNPSQYLNNLIKAVEMAGLPIEDVHADSWAMSHALISPKDKEVGCMLINIGGDTSSFIVFEEGSPISLEVLPIGSNHITYDIARAFQILLDEAEQLKISFGSDSANKKKLISVIEPRLNDIFELAENHLSKIKRTQLLPAGVFITGGGANLSGIEEIARKNLRLPVQLKMPQYPGMASSSADHSWSVALGLCSLGLSDERIGGSASKNMWHKTAQIFKHFLP